MPENAAYSKPVSIPGNSVLIHFGFILELPESTATCKYELLTNVTCQSWASYLVSQSGSPVFLVFTSARPVKLTTEVMYKKHKICVVSANGL